MNTTKQYLKTYENAISQELIDAIFREYKMADDWMPTGVKNSDGNEYVDKAFRDTDTILLSRPDVMSRNKETRQQIDSEIFAALATVIDRYMTEINARTLLSISQDTGYELLRYKTGGFFKEHTDAFDGINRVLSCSIALNDDYTGGEWSFFEGKERFKAPAGSIIVFPSNFMFPHEIQTVTSGERYSVVTWFN